jgi:hypothetical protein
MTDSHFLKELIKLWQQRGSYWKDNNAKKSWSGNTTELLFILRTNPTCEIIARDWTQARLGKALISLSQLKDGRVTADGNCFGTFNISLKGSSNLPAT